MQTEDPDQLHEQIRTIMMDIMAILYRNNFKTVRMGAMMRLLGVTDAVAAEHDQDVVELDEKFAEVFKELNTLGPIEIPKGTIIH
jgi:hypothetical protein